MIPREKPFTCHYPNKHNDSFVTECCKEYDLCNKDLKPKLHIKPPGRICYFLTLHEYFQQELEIDGFAFFLKEHTIQNTFFF